MEFTVQLLRVPPISELSGADVFDLMVNARHIRGDFWLFEGDPDVLVCPNVDVVGEAITLGHGDMDQDQFVTHCREIFGSVLRPN